MTSGTAGGVQSNWVIRRGKVPLCLYTSGDPDGIEVHSCLNETGKNPFGGKGFGKHWLVWAGGEEEEEGTKRGKVKVDIKDVCFSLRLFARSLARSLVWSFAVACV